MSSSEIAAHFRDRASAEAARSALERDGFESDTIYLHTETASADLGQRESRFIGRVILIVVAASIVGTAIGAAMGAMLSYTVGPSGSEGLILQIVSWAIFAHILIGMWAGYILLADRTGRDLPAACASQIATLIIAETTDHTTELTARLRKLGATEVTITNQPSPAIH